MISLNLIIKGLFPFHDFLYLLQLEEYESRRYLKLLKRFFLRRNFQERQRLVLTSRALAILIVSIGFYTSIFILTSYFFSPWLGIIVSTILIPMWILISNLILIPFYSYLKYSLQNKASRFVKDNFRGKIIAIAGSFGKTTTKNFIFDFIKYNYKTQMVPGNINTPTGVANWVLTNLDLSTEVLIVEMDSYFIGEIAKTCTITPPDISILLNVGDQHLERFGTKKNLQHALLEVFTFSKPKATLIFPRELAKHVKDRNRKIEIIDIEKEKNAKAINLKFALKVAEILQIPQEIIEDSMQSLTIPDRRHKETIIKGFSLIDDSYNISFTTAAAGLKSAQDKARTNKKTLVVVTGGIPELGVENKNANVDYGKLLRSAKVDVVLLKSILHEDILKQLDKRKVYLSPNLQIAWEKIVKNFSPDKVMILIQPELGDNYY